MLSKVLLAAAAVLPLAQADEQVLGIYVFHRHGDRTAKAWPPVNLTALGAEQVYSSGAFFRDRYVAADSAHLIKGVSVNVAATSQLDVTAPVDAVLHNSALTFLQGLYPPSGTTETLANGTEVEAPLGGYQYVPVNAVDDAATANKAESNAWLQGGSGCSNAVISSNNYFSSKEYQQLASDTEDFYQSILPVVNSTFSKDYVTYENGYSIFDLINVATIHNSSIPSDDLLTNSTLDKLYDLASVHEWNLAYNSSDKIRAVAGSVLAGQIVSALDDVVEKKSGALEMNIQFGAYGTFMAFFGLAQLPAASEDFYGICDYASSMTFELVTNSTDPKPEDVSVRFYFSNGTVSETGMDMYPLFGQDQKTLKWADFKDEMNKFAVQDTEHWCDMCGNTDGQCVSSDSDDSGDVETKSAHDSNNGISKAVAGVIGALVTLVVIFVVQAAIMLLGGFRLVKKSTLTSLRSAQTAAASGAKA